MGTIRWTRTDGDASEVLTLVRIDGQDDLSIQITTGPDDGDDFVGLYDLDGDQLRGNCTWEVVDESDLTAEQIESIRLDWETGTSSVERIADAQS